MQLFAPILRVRTLLLLVSVIGMLTTACGGKSDGKKSDAGAGAGSQAGAGSGASGSDANDAAVGDADAAADAAVDAGLDVPPVGSLPGRLSETGLYADIKAGTLAAGVEAYQVNSPLWADMASKERYIWLPPNTKIDTSDMDQWVFPKGTKLWKAFGRDGVRVETRLIEKLPSGEWEMVAYQWNADQTEALAVPDGVENASGTAHDIPEVRNCTWCHEGRKDRILGFSALQLSHDMKGLNLMGLAKAGLLTDPPKANFEYPGDDVSRPALQYLHGNCGHCHNPTRDFALGCTLALGPEKSVQCEGVEDHPRAARGQVVLFFWQSVHELDKFEDTITYKSLVQGHDSFMWPMAIEKRMGIRGGEQMPPVGTEEVDEESLAKVKTWIESLRSLYPDGKTSP